MNIRMHAATNTRFFFLALVTSVVTAMAMQRFNPALMLFLCLLPWFVMFFYYHPFFLVLLWHCLLFPTMSFPSMGFSLGPFWGLPMDPAYFFSLIYIAIISLSRPKLFLAAFHENPFLIGLLSLILLYTIIYTPTYGKQAIGEARKFYFFFFFPLLTVSVLKDIRDLHRLLLAVFLLSLALLAYSYWYLLMGSSLRGMASAQMALVFLYVVFSVLVFHLNKEVLINQLVDICILGMSLTVLILTQHRSVILAAAFGSVFLLWLYRRRVIALSKILISLVLLCIAMGIVVLTVPKFEEMTLRYISGIVNPSSDTTASWRMRGWQQQLNNLSGQELLFGEGLGSYFRWIDRGRAVEVEPHNGYIQLILKFGLFGLIIYLLLVVRFFWKVLPLTKALPPGRMRAFVELSILNFGAAHAYLMGYGFSAIMLVFYAMGMGAARVMLQHSESNHKYEQELPHDSHGYFRMNAVHRT